MTLDFNKIPNDLKSLLTHAIMLPFWMLSVYTFLPEFYVNNDMFIIGALCFCLTICSALAFSVISIKLDGKNKYVFDTSITFGSVVFQILWFSTLFIIGYVSKVLDGPEFEFYGFVLTYFIPLILFVIIFNNARKNTNKK